MGTPVYKAPYNNKGVLLLAMEEISSPEDGGRLSGRVVLRVNLRC